MALDSGSIEIVGYKDRTTEYVIELQSLVSDGERTTAELVVTRNGDSAILSQQDGYATYVSVQVNGSIVPVEDDSPAGIAGRESGATPEIEFDAAPGDDVKIEWVTDGWDGHSTSVSGTVEGPEFSAECSVAGDRAEPGENVEVVASITNDGNADGTASISLLVDGSEEDSADVEVPEGETVEQPFDVSFDDAGEYEIAFEGDGF